MRIIGFAQTVRLDRTPVEGYEIRVLLNSGEEVSIPTNEETVQALIQLSQGMHKSQNPGGYSMGVQVAPEERIPNTDEAHFPQDYVASTGDEDTSVFGGSTIEPSASSLLAPAQRIPTPATDEMGYPIVQQEIPEGMPRPAFLGGDDEDGKQI